MAGFVDEDEEWLVETTPGDVPGVDGVFEVGKQTAENGGEALELVANLRGVALYVSCGNGQLGPLDPPGTDPSGLLAQLEAALLLHNHEFVARALELDIDVTADFYGAGTHTWPYWRRQLNASLPVLMQAIGAA